MLPNSRRICVDYNAVKRMDDEIPPQEMPGAEYHDQEKHNSFLIQHPWVMDSSKYFGVHIHKNMSGIIKSTK
jgi:hypothetical protein